MNRIVFWNLNKKDLTNRVAEIVSHWDVDAIVLTESACPSGIILQALKSRACNGFFIPNVSDGGRFQCFCKNRELDLSEIHNGERLSVRKLRVGLNDCLIGFVHGFDIRNHDEATRQSLTQDLASEVRFVQNDQQAQSVLLLGDFNMNPFESGMNLALGWNAMMTRNCASRGQRRFKGKDYDFYYNPMWSLFGDDTIGPPGTFYDASSQGPYGWNMLDQVLVSHAMMSSFKSVKILTTTGDHSLADSKGRPDSKHASDHFPIMVEIAPEQDE